MSGDTAGAQIDALVARSGLDARGLVGEPATSVEYRVDAERTVQLLADVLADLHATDLTAAERDSAVGAERYARAAAAAHAEGRLRSEDRSTAYAHMDDGRLVEVLVDGAAGAAARRDRWVLTHGAPTLAHLWCSRGSAVGLVGWDRPAVADPYRDLAIAAHCIATEMAPILVPVLFERYGERSPDPVRLDWFALAAELLGPVGSAPT